MSTAGPGRAAADTGGVRSLEVIGPTDLPGAVSWAAASRRSRFRLLVPFILLCLLAVALATNSHSIRNASVLAIVIMVVAVVGRTLRSPERRVVLFG